MTDFIHPFGTKEMFEPNCKLTLSGDHFYSDKKLYSNFYGIAFFSSPDEYANNPHIAPALSAQMSIIDEFMSNGFPPSDSRTKGDYAIRQKIMQNIDKKFLATPSLKAQSVQDGKKLSCSYKGNVSFHGEDSLVLMYGSVVPSTICITGNAVSMMLPFSPFSSISFVKGKRTLQAIDYPVQFSPFAPPENITVDFATYAKDLSLKLREDLTGTLYIDYYLEVGGLVCERAKLKFDFAPLKMPDYESPDNTERNKE